MAPYRSVVWLTGRDWDTTLTAADQLALAAYLDGGGRLFVSGQDIGADLDGGGGANPFYRDYLHARLLHDNCGEWALTGVGPMEGLSFAIAGGDGADNQEYPSDIDAVGDGSGIFYYPDADWGAIAYAGDIYRVIYFAFGFEAISTRADRRETMRRVINYLGPCDTLDVEATRFLPLVLRA
jgi:hypothetical protein